MEQFSLPADIVDEIQQAIIENFTGHLKPVEAPHFYIVAAQPGSGKTELIKLIQQSLNNNVLICNADDLRNYHPDAKEILQNHESDYPEITWGYASGWNKGLKDEGIERRYNIIIETTLQDLQLVLNTLEEFKNHHYTIHMHVLAIPSALSWLGIRLRFETAKKDNGHARMVPDDIHDERFQSLQINLPVVVTSPHIDHIKVYTRKPLVFTKGTNCAMELLTDQRPDVLQAYKIVIMKDFSFSDKKAYYEVCTQITECMQIRNACPEEMEDFNINVKKRIGS